MAFRNASISSIVANALTTLYTVPANYEAVCHSIFVANTDSINSISISVTVTPTKILKPAQVIATNIVVPAGTTFEIDKSINLRETDIISITSSATTCTVFASILLVAADTVAP